MKRIVTVVTALALSIMLYGCTSGQSSDLTQTESYENVSWKINPEWRDAYSGDRADLKIDGSFSWRWGDNGALHVSFLMADRGLTPDAIIARLKETAISDDYGTPLGVDWSDESLGTTKVAGHDAYLYKTSYTYNIENEHKGTVITYYVAVIDKGDGYFDIECTDKDTLDAVLGTTQIA